MPSRSELYGQWVGQIAGTNSRYALLNVDRDRPTQASLQVDDPLQPFSAQVTLLLNGTAVSGTLAAFLPQGRPMPPEVHLAQSGTFSGTLEGDRLAGTWSTDVPTNGTFEMRCHDTLIAPTPDRVMSWREFRDWILEECQTHPSLIFRGHA